MHNTDCIPQTGDLAEFAGEASALPEGASCSGRDSPTLPSSVRRPADGSLLYEQVESSPCPGLHTTGEHLPDIGLIAVEPGNGHRLLECELETEPEGSISKLLVVGQKATWMHAGVAHEATLR